MTQVEWLDRVVRARLLAEHASYGGWPLLEDPLVVNDTLFVAEGYVQLSSNFVTAIGHVYPQQLSVRGVYKATFLGSMNDWTTETPSLDGNWTVTRMDTADHPCIFVRMVLFFGFGFPFFPPPPPLLLLLFLLLLHVLFFSPPPSPLSFSLSLFVSPSVHLSLCT